ncbi:hypothetical protein Pogu_2372 [Pyrobaculum oguniense TE7]|uniref:Uncharacterized protein n=1 Tax=Pyrobaculum oguniense (strain DSM 13380 / JCM 10595 / TE7) TaxID=698757 RepID=H6QBP8_PYROT|nr:hypothetical protein Pogu_2372 [Pyrobaculum oguniense TE7]
MYTGKCHMSELSKLEFVKVDLSKIVTEQEYKRGGASPSQSYRISTTLFLRR